jgi:hypothetical protein
MKVRARELAIAQNWKWKLDINFKEMDLRLLLLPQMTELTLEL